MQRDITGSVGNAYEFDLQGRRLAGGDTITLQEAERTSKEWPDTFHQWVDSTTGAEVWIKDGARLEGDPFRTVRP
jgi:hypothetical protein